MNLEKLIGKIFAIKIFRAMIALVIFMRGTFFFLTMNHYRASIDYCWLYRVSEIDIFKKISFYIIQKIIQAGLSKNENIILKSFLYDKASVEARERYSLSGRGNLDLFRDITILKENKSNEKGILLIKYTPTFDAFLAFFDIEKIFKDYYVVLETSWSGVCDPSILMFISPFHPVIIQVPEQDDFHFVASLKTNLLPVSLGSGDWVDIDTFSENFSVDNKIYDIIMVANWGVYKRHDELFKALAKIKSRQIKVMLIGFAWGGRTRQDIVREINQYNLNNMSVDFKEGIPPEEVKQYLNMSKVFILLSKKEGGNKAMVEGFFCNVPALLYENNKGGNKEKINSQTGILSLYEELSKNILYMIDNYKSFSPREWAIKNTGSKNATIRLNQFIRNIAEKKGESWTSDIVEKVNIPNLAYKNTEDRMKFNKNNLISYLRS
ncbi:MAG: glycosyltransferase [Nitrospirae bacterium]|nr:glycosyltransferase [Nitrospirota bacterium]